MLFRFNSLRLTGAFGQTGPLDAAIGGAAGLPSLNSHRGEERGRGAAARGGVEGERALMRLLDE